MWKECYLCGMRPSHAERILNTWKETYICGTNPIDKETILCMWKETYICGNNAIYVVRHELLASLLDLYMWKETYICGKNPMYEERVLYMWKETCRCGNTAIYVVRHVLFRMIALQRPLFHIYRTLAIVERDIHMWGILYVGKKLCTSCDMYVWRLFWTYISGKRPIYVERDLYLWENCYVRCATCCRCTSGVSFGPIYL